MQPLVNFSLYDKLKSGGPAVGAWITSTDPAVAEIVAGHDWDFIVVETEHAPFNPESLRNVLMGIRTDRRPAIVRVPWRFEPMIKQALDCGAAGVLVPRIETPEQAAEAISYTRYPPKGRRGFAPLRAGNYSRALNEYSSQADKVLCFFMIETVPAVEHIDEICALDGLGGLLIGPADLAVDLGLMDHIGEDHPRLREAVTHVYEAAEAAGVAHGMVTSSPEAALKEIEQGATLVTAGSDLSWVRRAAAAAFERVQDGLKTLGK